LSIRTGIGIFARIANRLSREPSMTPSPLRLVSGLGRHTVGSDGFALELIGERASALRRAGKAVELALAALRDGAPADREALLRAAATAVWAFFVQREACGFRDQKGVIAHYEIPKAVLVRLGAL
jgi:hypothetical protein